MPIAAVLFSLFLFGLSTWLSGLMFRNKRITDIGMTLFIISFVTIFFLLVTQFHWI